MVSRADPTEPAVGTARRFVRQVLEGLGVSAEATDDLVLATDELVTNAVLHARTPFRVALRRLPQALRVEIFDANPVRRGAGPHRSMPPTGEACGLSRVSDFAGVSFSIPMARPPGWNVISPGVTSEVRSSPEQPVDHVKTRRTPRPLRTGGIVNGHSGARFRTRSSAVFSIVP